MARSMDEDMAAIEDLLDDFDQVARGAFATYRGYAPEVLLEHDVRAAAACTYCHMVAEADRRFLGRAGITTLDVRGLKVWLVGDSAIIRFKKMDEDGRTRNYPTKQAVKFDKGDPLPGLPEPATRLSIGYLLDLTQTQFVRTQIAKPAGRRTIEWCAAIVPAGPEGGVGARRWEDVTRQGRFGGT
jgi:hypothetical protein